MRFLILRLLTHSELGMFHEYRRQAKEGSKQRAVNYDWDVVDRVFPAAKDSDRIEMDLRYDTDNGVSTAHQWLKRQEKNWRLEGNCPTDKCYGFVDPDCLFAMEVEAGTSPATGSWAVFPADDAVTKAILADGESSGLASSAMIALHADEGERTWRTLAGRRPDLFSAPPARSTGAVRRSAGGVELQPNPRRLVDILAAVGHSMPAAVADLVDNSISANATEVAITFGRPDGGHGRWMSIADNGDGMSAEALQEAMRVGGEAQYEDNSLGKYGYGLKGASWSQTKVFTVLTKRTGTKANHLTWDVEDMASWIAKSGDLEPWENEAATLGSHGTVVLWKNMRPPQTMPTSRGLDPHSSEIRLLERHLALVFHRFLEGKAGGRRKVAIAINGIPVEPNNPVSHPLVSAYDAKTIRIPTGSGDGKVLVKAYLLPSEEEIEKHHKAEGPESVRRALERIGLHGKRNETQGLFIYRHDRLITWGGWHQMWETNDEKTKLARVVVDFDRVLDESFKVNISKQVVHLPAQLQAEIKPLATVARKDSQKKYRKPRPVGGSGSTTATQNGTKGGSKTAGGAPTRTGGSPPPGSSSGGPTPPPPQIGSRAVKTDKFVWKVTRTLTGTVDIQVSELDPDLSALVKHLGSDPHALARLAKFLEHVDQEAHRKQLLADRSN